MYKSITGNNLLGSVNRLPCIDWSPCICSSELLVNLLQIVCAGEQVTFINGSDWGVVTDVVGLFTEVHDLGSQGGELLEGG